MIFDVLAEPARRRILDLLLEGPQPVGELTARTGLTQPGTSKHLRVLREAGLVTVRQDAQRRWYELVPEPLAELDAWLTPYRRLWSAHLDALERVLDDTADSVGFAGSEGPVGFVGETAGSAGEGSRWERDGSDSSTLTEPAPTRDA